MSKRGAELLPEEKEIVTAALLGMLAEAPAAEREGLQATFTGIVSKLGLAEALGTIAAAFKAATDGGGGEQGGPTG